MQIVFILLECLIMYIIDDDNDLDNLTATITIKSDNSIYKIVNVSVVE
jgi:hypothetical protein